MSAEQPHIFSISEIERQRAVLGGLRSKHAAEMVLSGFAGKMIRAFGPANETANHEYLNEGSELVPARIDMAAIEDPFLDTILQDLILANNNSGGDMVDDIAFSRRLIKLTVANHYAISVFRHDSPPDSASRVGCKYTVGCNIANGWRLPADGLETEDVAFIEGQLEEVNELRMQKELTMLDPVTLVDRNPLLIRHR